MHLLRLTRLSSFVRNGTFKITLCIFALFSSFGSTVLGQVPTNGLVAYYPLDGDARDRSGSSNDGTIFHVTPVADRSGNLNSAYQFNGTDSVITIPHAAYQNAMPITVACWFKVTGTWAREGALVSKYSAGSWNGWQIGINPDTHIVPWYLVNSSNTVIGDYGNPSFLGGGSLVENSWHHVVFTVDGTSGGKLFVDGALVSQRDWVGPAQADTSTNPIRIGFYDGVGSFNGAIDEVRIYNRALSSTEVTQFYNAQKVPSPQQSLVAEWKLEGNSNDAVGTTNGTAQNVQWVTSKIGDTNKAVAFLGGSSATAGITVPKTAVLDLPSTGYTILGWVNSPSFAGTPPPNTYFTLFASQGISGSQEDAYILRYGPQGLNFQISSLDNYPAADPNARNIKFVKTTDANSDVLAANRWYLIAVTYDGSTVRGYVDGVALTAQGNASLANVAPKSTSRNSTIGMRVAGVTGGYDPANNGYISDVRIYNRALTVSELLALAPAAATSVAPTITTQPASIAVAASSSATFTVVAGGSPTPTYQWQKNSSNVSGATNATYTIGSASSADVGSYTVIVTNSAGTVTSSAALLTVTSSSVAPAITTQPTSQTVATGTNAMFQVVATGVPAPSYQWQKNGSLITGATSATYTIGSASSADVGTYTVIATNSAGAVTSSAALLTVTSSSVAPAITTQPASQTVVTGANVTFQVVATGTQPLGYQWQRNGTAIVGATNSSYSIGNIQPSNSGGFTVVVANSAGTITSATATLLVSAPSGIPVIIGQPSSQTLVAGASLTLSVIAQNPNSGGTLSYQWSKGGSVIVGATNASLVIPSVVISDAGNYSVVVANSAGSTASSTAVIGVQAPTVSSAGRLINLSILTSLNEGETMTFGTVVGGGGTVGTKPLLIRAAGPALNQFGLSNFLKNPTVTLLSTSVSPAIAIETNSSWGSSGSNLSAIFSSVGAFPFLTGSNDSSIYRPVLAAGNYTMQMVDARGGSGFVLAEVYDATSQQFFASTPRLINLSVQKRMAAGSSITAGFVIRSGSMNILIRAVGPTLGQTFGVPEVMADPRLELYNASGTKIYSNNDWATPQSPLTTTAQVMAQNFLNVGAFPLAGTLTKDAAIFANLPAGNYTVVVQSADSQSGVVLVEVYEAP